MSAIRVRDLRRIYTNGKTKTDIIALDTISFDVERSEVRGLLGPNGAGKTTLVKILSTVLLPTSGSATVLGYDVVTQTAKVRPLIGIVFGGDKELYYQLTGRQTLEYWAALYNVPVKDTKSRINALLDRVGLLVRADDRVHTYSRGMKQRLHLARGLVANAQVLFLDEPTIGMDPIAARDFRRLVGELQAEGRTILLTTHDMAEAEAVCDRVALIDRGRILAVETPGTLAQLVAKHERIDFDFAAADLSDSVRRLAGVASIKSLTQEQSYRIELADGKASTEVLGFLVSSGVKSIRTTRPSLEEVYVHMIGDRGLRV